MPLYFPVPRIRGQENFLNDTGYKNNYQGENNHAATQIRNALLNKIAGKTISRKVY